MFKRAFLGLLIMVSIGKISAQDIAAKRVQLYNLEKGIAINGYDPVSYFLDGKAQKGTEKNALYHQGVTYWFTSSGNKELFKKNPAKYEPAYGGWCAYAMGAKGEKVEVDPETFKVIDGRLFLFYNKFFNNTLLSWNKEEQSLKAKAEVNWNKFLH